MSVVANVAVNLDATSVVQRLKQIRDSAIGAGDAFKKLDGSAKAVKAAVEASGGGFAKASTVVGVFSAKVKNTENAIRAQIAALKAVQASVQLGGALYQKAAGQIKQYEDALRKASGAADGAGGGMDGLKGKIAAFVGGLALATTAINVVKSSLNAAFERGQAETRLRALTSAYGETTEATKLASAASDKFGITQTEATKAIGDVYGRLRPLGFSLKEISGVYDGFNTLTMQAGLSSAEASSVFTQLSQALGSGTLRGDEFNRMAESMPAILGVVSKELGVSQNELRGMAADGKISADVVVRALQKVADAGGDLDKFLDPSTKAMNKLKKETEDAMVAFGNLLKPAAINIMNDLAKALEFTTKNLKQIAKTAVFFATFAGTLKLIALGTQAWAIASKALAAGQKAAGIAAAFLQGVMNPASLATTALALGAATGASILLGKAMDGAATDAAKVDPEVQKAAKATTQAAEAAKKMKEAIAAAKAKATELAIELQTKVVSAAKAASDAIQVQVERQSAIGSIVAARIDSEQKLNGLQKIGLEQAYATANTTQKRYNIAIALFQNEVKAAALQYQAARAAILIDNEKIKLQQQAAVLKGYEILAEGQLQILQAKSVEEENKKRQALGEALAAQNNVIRAVVEQGVAQKIVNGYQLKSAETLYATQVATAGIALKQKLVSDEIGLSINGASNLTQGMVNAATSAQTMTNVSSNLSTKMNDASNAIKTGTDAAVQNVQVFSTAAVTSAQSQDKWRESVLKGIGAQQQVVVATEQTTAKVVAANNIRATSAVQTDKQIAESSGFSSKRVQENFGKIPQWFATNVTQPIQFGWDKLVNFLPSALKKGADLIKNIFSAIPVAIKVSINAVMRGVFGALNSAIDRINSIIRAANAISAKVKGPQFRQLDNVSIPQFAKGGYVGQGTLAVVGEAGPEYIIPASKMAAASANFLGGARGSAVIPAFANGGYVDALGSLSKFYSEPGSANRPAVTATRIRAQEFDARIDKFFKSIIDGSINNRQAPSNNNAQINITTGPVIEFNNEKYVTMTDMEKAMRKTADGVYASLRTPAGRYVTGTR